MLAEGTFVSVKPEALLDTASYGAANKEITAESGWLWIVGEELADKSDINDTCYECRSLATGAEEIWWESEVEAAAQEHQGDTNNVS